ncbi:MAG: DNA translocase FtsK 4TM domain-containing protein, partial [Actinomycetota bacterium]
MAKKKKRRSRKKKPSVFSHLQPLLADAIGIGLVVVALVSALGIWIDGAGPVGAFLRFIARGSLGVVGLAFPIFALWWGLVLVRGTEEEDRGRMGLGLTMAFFGGLGIWSLIAGNPAPADGYKALADGGGMIGAIVAWPLSQVISPLGAGIVCTGLLVLGALVFSATPFADVIEMIRAPFQREEAEEEEEAPEPKAKKSKKIPEPEEEPALVGPVMIGEEYDSEPIELPEVVSSGEDGDYELPPLDLLRTAPATAPGGRDEEEVMKRLEATLRNFGVDAKVSGYTRGPSVTLFEVNVGEGTKVKRVLALGDDIAYALATPEVRIIAPIPGKSAIGIEVPNDTRDFVTLGDVLRSKTAQAEEHPLAVGLGKDVHGRSALVKLNTMPHLLIAGATGAGKSSLINAFVTSVLMRTSPEDVRMVLIDPKRVELSHFADLPHLLAPVIVHPKRAAESLGWVVREMEMRYEIMATVGVRDIDSYNEAWDEDTMRIPPGRDDDFDRLPYILVVIDELADLMMVAPRDVEDAICRIAQMARAVGIHL